MSVDFIGIGTMRSGTSWIAMNLRAHPQICVSEPKEIRYFNRYLTSRGIGRRELNPNYDEGLDWYLKHFKHARKGQVVGEYSPSYLYDDHAAIAIKRCFPDIKLIACLRNPVDRAYSHYRMWRGNATLGNISFEEALEQDEIYVGMGHYAKQLKAYLDHFERDQILILIFEELIRCPEHTIPKIFRFLDVSPELPLDYAGMDKNPAAHIRSTRMMKTAVSASRFLINARLSFVLNALRELGAHSLFTKINKPPLRYPPMTKETSQRLMEIFSEDISELERLLERDLKEWRDHVRQGA